MSHVTVLKFGSSVLRTASDLSVAVHEIYAELRQHRQVIAVVSAFEGVTDRLFAEALRAHIDSDNYALARYVAAGEQDTAAQLVRKLDEAGIPACEAEPTALGLLARGEPLEATPYELNTQAVQRELSRASVLVVPGFFAADIQGRTVLLGRGGSDLSALFIARQLRADCRLVKDVAGIYATDPALTPELPPRFAQVRWERALEVGGHLVQPRALRFAQRHRQLFTVGAAGCVHRTRVGPGPDEFACLPSHQPPLRVALLGLGTVGLGVYQHLASRPDLFAVRRIVVRDPGKPRETTVPPGLLSTHLWDAVHEPVDLIIEAIGGVEPVADVIQSALLRGRAVVTANKGLIATRWPQLKRFAAGPGKRLRFSAAVGGAVPALEVIETIARRGSIQSLRAVINGTCNYLLDAMARGAAFAAAVQDAQACGFAEADAQSDLSGEDAAFKLRIMARAAFGECAADQISCCGIEQITAADVSAVEAAGRSVRLVASGERGADGQVRLSVQPCELAREDFLAGARNEENRLEVYTADGGCVRLSGKGAGRWPTAVAVMGDVYAHLRESQSAQPDSSECEPGRGSSCSRRCSA